MKWEEHVLSVIIISDTPRCYAYSSNIYFGKVDHIISLTSCKKKIPNPPALLSSFFCDVLSNEKKINLHLPDDFQEYPLSKILKSESS